MSYDLVWVEVEGAVVVKPSISHYPSGAAKLKFGVLCEPKYYSTGKATRGEKMYFNVAAIGTVAEVCYHTLKIGMPVRVEGEYKDSVYTDRTTDEQKVGRLIMAKRIRALVFWKYRTPSEQRRQELERTQKLITPDLDELPF